MKELAASPAPPPRAALLNAADALIDGVSTGADLEHHGLHLLAARRWRELGRPVTNRFLAQERMAAAIWLATPSALERIRAAYDGDLLLIKGPEVAAVYPDPVLRRYGDLDLLVSDAHAAQRALMAAGFEPQGNERRYADLHHLRPLRVPQLPLKVEVHHAPKWPEGLYPPSTAELLESGVPARCGVEGIMTLRPSHHAVLLAAHAWAHAPLGQLRKLLDIGLVAADADPTDLARVANRWGASQLWRATVGVLNGLFGGAQPPATLRLWARHLASVRERTVLEKHLTAWLSPLWCFPRSERLRECAAAFLTDVRPLPREAWHDKLVRTRMALANASVGASEHHALLHGAGLDRDGSEAGRER
jgi:Uncharacterised nucleotidyltransferase